MALSARSFRKVFVFLSVLTLAFAVAACSDSTSTGTGGGDYSDGGSAAESSKKSSGQL